MNRRRKRFQHSQLSKNRKTNTKKMNERKKERDSPFADKNELEGGSTLGRLSTVLSSSHEHTIV